MAHTQTSHGTYMNESRHIYRFNMSHVTDVDASQHRYRCVMAHTQTSHATHTTSDADNCCDILLSHVTFAAYAWVMSHIWMRHGTHRNESWHTYSWVTSHLLHIHTSCHRCTAYYIWSVMSCISSVIHWLHFLGVFCHILVKRDLWIREKRLMRLCVLWFKWYRVAKTHRMPCLYRSFSAKEPYI